MAISYDPVEKLKEFAVANGITFLLLSDEGSRTINAYHVHHSDGYSIPGTYLIDQDGIIRADFFLDGYVQRHENVELIDAAKAISND